MSKYRAKIVVADGLRFHSQGEYARWLELRILEAAGKIKALKRQVSYALRIAGHPLLIRSDRYPNGRGCRYVADFEYVEDGIRIVEDYKGFDTSEARLRRAVFEATTGLRIRITGPAAQRTRAA